MHDIPNISFTDEHLSTESKILAIHDISDGGLVTCLLEMAIAGWGGLAVDLPPAPAPSPTSQDKVPPTLAALFSEEVGYIGYVKFAPWFSYCLFQHYTTHRTRNLNKVKNKA